MFNVLIISKNLLLSEKVLARLESILWIKCSHILFKKSFKRKISFRLIIKEYEQDEIKSKKYGSKTFIFLPSIARSKRLILNKLTQIVFLASISKNEHVPK